MRPKALKLAQPSTTRTWPTIAELLGGKSFLKPQIQFNVLRKEMHDRERFSLTSSFDPLDPVIGTTSLFHQSSLSARLCLRPLSCVLSSIFIVTLTPLATHLERD